MASPKSYVSIASKVSVVSTKPMHAAWFQNKKFQTKLCLVSNGFTQVKKAKCLAIQDYVLDIDSH